MNDANLIIAKELLEILAKYPCVSAGSMPDDLELYAVKRIIEAARINYVLPTFCAEMNTQAGKCIRCIIDHEPPEVCRAKIDADVSEDLDIAWD